MAYCVKCKSHRIMRSPRPTVLKNRKRPTRATRGTCPSCGTTMFEIHR